MSWWDRYLAPGDLRRRQQQQAQHPPPPPTSTALEATADHAAPHAIVPPTTSTAPTRITASHRARRQNALFYGGLAFSLLSLTLTRRTIARKRIAAYPSLFTPSHMHIAPPPAPQQQQIRVEGSILALEALGLATLNVFSFFMAGIGGAMMWFDVAEAEDLRRTVVEGTAVDAYGGEVDEATEKEVQGWIAQAFGQGQEQARETVDAGQQQKGLDILRALEESQREKDLREGKT